MIEIFITSSVLILCIMLIRRIFRGKISSRLQYGLWLLAVLRLVVPVGIQLGDMNELRLTDWIKSAEMAGEDRLSRLEEPITINLDMTGRTGELVMRFLMPQDASVPTHSLSESETFIGGADGPTSVFLAGRLGVSWLDIIRWIWYGGMLVMALWMLGTNLVFSIRLRRGRKPYEPSEETALYLREHLPAAIWKRITDSIYMEASEEVKECKAEKKSKDIRSNRRTVKIYLVPNLASSCLYGLPGREAVYLTTDTAEDNQKLCHVLTHEICHKRHGDGFWSVVRSVLVTVYWFHPFVWVAAVLSKRDCELACDEAALALLGEEERIPYGETLLSIITRKGKLSDFACTATTMTGSGKSVKERIALIAEKPKRFGIAVAAVLLLAVGIVIFCFTRDPRYEGGRVLGASARTLVTEDMQIFLPASIGGISGDADEKNENGTRDIIIYQTASGKEVGRFCKRDVKEALQLIDEGRTVVPLGDYGYNYLLWEKLGVERGQNVSDYKQDFESGLYGVSRTEHYYTPANAGEEETTAYSEENAVRGEDAAADSEGGSVQEEETAIYSEENSVQEEETPAYSEENAVQGEDAAAYLEESSAQEEQAAEYSAEDYVYEEDDTTYLIDDEVVYLPAEKIETVQLPPEEINIDGILDSACYIYLKADYSGVKDKYLEEMEFINGELESVTEQVVVLGFTQSFRMQMYEKLAENRTLYIGDNSKVSALIQALPVPDGLTYESFAIDTAEEGKYTLRIYYGMENRELEDIDAHMVFFDAVMLFACIGNMDECMISVNDDSAAWTYYRTDLEEVDAFNAYFHIQSLDNESFAAEMELLYSDIVKYLRERDGGETE